MTAKKTPPPCACANPARCLHAHRRASLAADRAYQARRSAAAELEARVPGRCRCLNPERCLHARNRRGWGRT